MNFQLTPQQARLMRLSAQRLLYPPVFSPPEIVRRVLAVQAQELPAAGLGVRARSTGLTAADVDRARLKDRSLAWTWSLRGTLHLLAAGDARWLVPLLGPALVAADRRRMAQLGWTESQAQEGIRLVRQAVEAQGPRTREEIARLLQENGLPYEGQAAVHLLYRAALEGILCSGPDQDGKPTYTLFEAWLGAPQPLERPEGLARLARRYLQAYAPATPQDFAAWAGVKQGEARLAWQEMGDQMVETAVAETAGGQTVWLLEEQLSWLDGPPPPEPVVRLLPRYDTLWMGYANRDLLVDPSYRRRVNRGGGIVHPCLLVDGRILGTWKTRKSRRALEIIIEPFEPLAGGLRQPIEAEIADIGRFLGAETRLEGGSRW